MSKNVLFCSRNDIIKRTPVGANIDPDKIVPYIKIAQDKSIFPILGTVLYEKLQSDVQSGSLAGNYLTLMNEYIIDTLVHYSMVEALPYLAYTFGNGSIVKNLNSEQGSSPAKVDIDFLLNKSLQTAGFYAERLVSYLIAHNDWFPEYIQSTGYSDNVYPAKGQTYKRGWIL